MAKKIAKLTKSDIILSADAETIKQALQARVEIDRLLVEREKAYQAIAELEVQVEGVLEESGTFPFPSPPLPVAGYAAKGGSATRPKAVVPKVVVEEEEPEEDEEDFETETVDEEESEEASVEDEAPDEIDDEASEEEDEESTKA